VVRLWSRVVGFPQEDPKPLKLWQVHNRNNLHFIEKFVPKPVQVKVIDVMEEIAMHMRQG